MTTINDQDDFLEALRNNPQWRDAVRAQVLGDDLMELPAKFDAFVEEQKAHNEKLDGFVQKFDAFVEEQRNESCEPRCPAGPHRHPVGPHGRRHGHPQGRFRQNPNRPGRPGT